MKNIFLVIVSILFIHTVQSQIWQVVSSGTQLQLNSVSFGTELVGYIGANDSTLLKTTDGGMTWNVQPTQGFYFSSSLPNIAHIEFQNADSGYAILGDQPYVGDVYKTEDGGVSWTPVGVGMCSPISSFHFDSDNGFIIGSSCFGGKTIDKLVNGVVVGNPIYLSWGSEYLRSLDFYDANYGMAAGDSGQVHRTFDGGLTWDTVNTLSKQIIWDAKFVNDSTIYAAIDSSRNSLIFSVDSGVTWNEYINSQPFFDPQWKALTGIQNNGILAVGDAALSHTGVILWGNKQDASWALETTIQILNDVTTINDSLAITVGDSGLIMRNTGIINSVPKINSQVQVMVYPNPAQETISVSSRNDKVEQVTIFDMLGREVLTESVQFEQIQVNTLNPGLYQVRVKTTHGQKVKPLLVQ
ncbi:MAG: T9SS type A sorting domain-containing protein [Salibacteraceae bacterium]